MIRRPRKIGRQTQLSMMRVEHCWFCHNTVLLDHYVCPCAEGMHHVFEVCPIPENVKERVHRIPTIGTCAECGKTIERFRRPVNDGPTDLSRI